MNNKIKNRKKHTLALTTIVMIVVVAICGLLTWYQLYKLEKGILDVCATQQDAYVQLVLDQINLKENRDDEEIITDILSTLDSSNNKYWTFSKDRDMLFVKDIIETNRYKGLTTGSYYESESAKEFLESLQVDRVIHKNIIVNGKDYVASGVAFRYDNDDYRLCLLTNKDVILNNNQFMGAKIEMVILMGFVLVVLLAVTMSLARMYEGVKREVDDRDESIEKLQGMVGQLNELLCQKEHYDTRYQLWSKESIKDFLEKLRMKDMKKVVAVRLHCFDETDKFVFLEKAGILLDKKVLRFVLNETDIYLLYVQYKESDVRKSLEPLTDKRVIVKKIEELVLGELNLDHYVQGLDVEVQNGY